MKIRMKIDDLNTNKWTIDLFPFNAVAVARDYVQLENYFLFQLTCV